MMRRRTLALACAAVALTAGTAAAQGFTFSYGIGDPYYDPYYRPYYRVYPQPPAVYYEPAPVVVAPSARSQVVTSPEEAADDLQQQGFTRLSPIDIVGETYTLTADDPQGNFVSVVVSMRSGQIVDLRVLQPSRRATPTQRVAPMPAPAPRVAATPKIRPAPQQPAPVAAAPAPASTAAIPAPTAAVPAGGSPPAPARGSKDPLVVY